MFNGALSLPRALLSIEHSVMGAKGEEWGVAKNLNWHLAMLSQLIIP